MFIKVIFKPYLFPLKIYFKLSPPELISIVFAMIIVKLLFTMWEI